MGKHNKGVQSSRDFRSTTAQRAYHFLLARRRWERHAALASRH